MRADDEIEITPEMLRAGRRELAGFDHNADVLEDVVSQIFREMIRSHRERVKQSSKPRSKRGSTKRATDTRKNAG